MELCTYGIQITLANFINFIIAFGIALLFGRLPEMAVFYFIFVSLRYFCGGYHADSYGRCFALFAATCLLYLLMVAGVMACGGSQGVLLASAMGVLGTCIWKRAPIEHINRPFTPEERKKFRGKCVGLYLFWSIFGIALWIWAKGTLSAGFISVFIIIAFYMAAGRRRTYEEETA